MKFLVPIDGSKESVRALKQAIGLCRELQASGQITLLSVHDDAALRHVRSFVSKAQIEDYLRELSDKDLKSALKAAAKSDVRYDVVIRTGHIAQEIVAFATAGKFDMIVMGSKGRTGLSDLLLGSVAQRVVARAKQAVLLVH